MPKRNFKSCVILLMLGLFPGCAHFAGPRHTSDPLTAEQHVQLGTAYQAQGLAAAAIGEYERARRLDKKYIPAYVALGNNAFDNGQMPRAKKYYRQALRLDPHHSGANNNLAMVYLTLGQNLEKAEHHAQVALRQNDFLRPYVLETLATLYTRQGRLEEAQSALDEAQATAPPNSAAFMEALTKTQANLDLKTTSKRTYEGEDYE